MRTWMQFIRPSTFIDGRYYLRRQVFRSGCPPRFILVQFAAYDPCPAWVIVRNQDGSRERVPREEIFKEFPVIPAIRRKSLDTEQLANRRIADATKLQQRLAVWHHGFYQTTYGQSPMTMVNCDHPR